MSPFINTIFIVLLFKDFLEPIFNNLIKKMASINENLDNVSRWDVDSWNYSTTPEAFLEGKEQLMHLSVHHPAITDHGYFRQWMTITGGSEIIRIPPQFKNDFLDCINHLVHFFFFFSLFFFPIITQAASLARSTNEECFDHSNSLNLI